MLSLVHLVKCIHKPMYFGYHDKYSNKTNILYFKNKEDAHKCKVSINDFYHKHKRSPQIKEINLDTGNKCEDESKMYVKIHTIHENNINHYLQLGNLNSCHCIIDKRNRIWCIQKQTTSNKDIHLYLDTLYQI